MLRIVTAASLFDGHDVSINLFRRLLQRSGCEVIHLGHNRPAREITRTAIEEDADAVLVSSYQGGHMEFYGCLRQLLDQGGAEDVRIYGGGGGVILPAEIEDLSRRKIARVFHAEEGRRIGLDGIVATILNDLQDRERTPEPPTGDEPSWDRPRQLGRWISYWEDCGQDFAAERNGDQTAPVIGITGTGGAGKSSLADELVQRFLRAFPSLRVAICSVDPTSATSGGALLGDRIRMNHIYPEDHRVFMRSLATRGSTSSLSPVTAGTLELFREAGFDLIFLETSGIGQGDSRVTGFCDLSLYVMTAEFGAPSQLEKINMLELADLVAVNKYEKSGSEDALREIRIHRARLRVGGSQDERPAVFGTRANRFNDPGVNRLFLDMVERLEVLRPGSFQLEQTARRLFPTADIPCGSIIRRKRENYLSEIADTVRAYRRRVEEEARWAGQVQSLDEAARVLAGGEGGAENTRGVLQTKRDQLWKKLSPESREYLENWDALASGYGREKSCYQVRGKPVEVEARTLSLSGSSIPKVVPPPTPSWEERLRYRGRENFPGYFPFTAGIFPFKRQFEDPKRQFAGEGGPERTNRRFHYLCQGDEATRLSVAFDSITLYGENPEERLDLYGKIGESGVSIATLDDMRKLLAGFRLLDPATSVSMTINGPAPIVLAMFFNVAAEEAISDQERKLGRALAEEERAATFTHALRTVRGTVQADILKEDQGQNTCIFSIDFALRLLGDVQCYFAEHRIENFYSLSISGYHIAEAGANPITQLAFTLANGFTYVEYFLERGIPIDRFAPALSFFFSSGMEPEYSVIGRVARRIWAVALRDRYGANERGQKLKYHIQTSGRSLHAQEIDFNDIRTTLQALLALADNCNSLHTNSYDEAVTTPTEESVRRSMAIQLILMKEFGLLKNENLLSGSYFHDYLTDLVERAVLEEFDRLSSRGGVIGAMEKQYQRSRIQEESMDYELAKHQGRYPIVGVNTYVRESAASAYDQMTVSRATPEEKRAQLAALDRFHGAHRDHAPAALAKLRDVALSGGNLFAELLESVKVASLGQITRVLYEVGGQYRRGM
ncbi:MAG: fused isobutyryl-CoA mutase/GTPase IcmF [Actinomycetota bacterium]